MTRIVWDQTREYDVGVDRGVLYPQTSPGVPWNGLVSVQEAVSESEERSRYIDGVRLSSRRSFGSFAATIKAYTYPDEFMQYDSFSDSMISRQIRKRFDLAYRVQKGEDSHLIHLVYNALAAPSHNEYASSGPESNPTLFSWKITTTPRLINSARASAHLVVDTSKAYPWCVSALEDILYGTDTDDPRMPSPDEVLALFEANAILRVVDNGDGTFTATGPDDAIVMLDADTFQVTWETAVMIDEVSYNLSSR